MNQFAKLILGWYANHGRKLPWRNHPDPYVVWVSEIMLQQTQVTTVIPYFERWMDRFPDIATLANSSEQEVLLIWEGLGYYARVRNLRKAAQIIMKEYGEVVPREITELRKLPGIGRYTAAAIASMSYGTDVATLDGNLKRVFARVFNVTLPVNTSPGETKLWELAEKHLPQGKAGEYNQALMDLGATICLPQKPNCLICPLKLICKAQTQGLQNILPIKIKKSIIPMKVHAAAVIVRKTKVLMAQRMSKGLLGGMWGFPAAEVHLNPALDLKKSIEAVYKLKVDPVSLFATLHHAYTHFKLTEHVYLCNLENKGRIPKICQWILISDLIHYPMGKVDRQIARKLMSKNG
jgi:A/G-specific adenine glycosylase